MTDSTSHSNSLHAKAQKLMQAGQYDYAFSLLEQYSQLEPQNFASDLNAQQNMRVCCLRTRKTSRNLFAAFKMLLHSWKFFWAELQYISEDNQQASQLYHSLAVLFPNCLHVHNRLLNLAERSRNIEQMKAALQEILLLKPQNTELTLQLANLYSQTNQIKQAQKLYEQILKQDPQNGAAIKGLHNLDALLSLSNEITNEMKSSPRAILSTDPKLKSDNTRTRNRDSDRESPATHPAWQALWQDCLQQSHEQAKFKAAQRLKHVLAENPSYWNSLQALVLQELHQPGMDVIHAELLSAVDPSKALHLYESILAQHPHNVRYQIAYHSSQLHMTQDEREKQDLERRIFELKIMNEPRNESLRLSFARWHYDHHNWEDSIGHLQKISKQGSWAVAASLLLAKCFLKQNLADLAQRQIEEKRPLLATGSEEHKQALYVLAQCREKLGLASEAREAYKEIYQHDIHFKDVKHKVL